MRTINVCLYLGLILFLTVIVSCSDNDNDSPDDDRYQKQHAGEVIDGIDKYLGKGYKGYQYYANPKSCTLALFDVSNHEDINIQHAPSHSGRYVSGENKTEFYDQFSADVSIAGTYDGFSGEITSNFKQSVLRNRNYSYATSHITQTYYRLSLLETAKLTNQAKQDLENLAPIDLFNKYGTHYLKSIYIGGRVSFSSYIDRSSFKELVDMEASMSAAYGEVVSGSGSISEANKKAVEQLATNKQIDVIGGDPAEANGITTGAGEPSDTYKEWSRSVEKHMSIADFADGGLVPIYELVNDSERRTELITAWNQYMDDYTDDVLTEGEPDVIKKNGKFKLHSSDGRYIGGAEIGTLENYPTMADKGVTLEFGGSSDDLLNEHIVTIKTTEKFKRLRKNNKFLHAGTIKWLFYKKQGGAKNNWKIIKKVPSSDSTIRYGDTVIIKNQHYTKKPYLAPSSDNYLTSLKDEHIWTIEQK